MVIQSAGAGTRAKSPAGLIESASEMNEGYVRMLNRTRECLYQGPKYKEHAT